MLGSFTAVGSFSPDLISIETNDPLDVGILLNYMLVQQTILALGRNLFQNSGGIPTLKANINSRHFDSHPRCGLVLALLLCLWADRSRER